MNVKPAKNYVDPMPGVRKPRPPRGAVPPAGGDVPFEPEEAKKGSRLNKALAALACAAAVVSLGDWPWNGGGKPGDGPEATANVSLEQGTRTATEGFAGTDGFAIGKGETLYLLSRGGSGFTVAVVRGGIEYETSVPVSDLERRTSR